MKGRSTFRCRSVRRRCSVSWSRSRLCLCQKGRADRRSWHGSVCGHSCSTAGGRDHDGGVSQRTIERIAGFVGTPAPPFMEETIGFGQFLVTEIHTSFEAFTVSTAAAAVAAADASTAAQATGWHVSSVRRWRPRPTCLTSRKRRQRKFPRPRRRRLSLRLGGRSAEAIEVFGPLGRHRLSCAART